MNRLWLRMLALLALTLSSAAVAQDVTVTSDVVDTASDKPRWEAGAAGVAVSVPDYPASDRYRTLPLPVPYFVYRGRVLKSDDEGTRLEKTLSQHLRLDISGSGSFSSPRREDGPRANMPKLGYLTELGPNLKVLLARPNAYSGWLIDLPVRGVVSFGGGGSSVAYRGLVFAPDLAYQTAHLFGTPFSLRASLGAKFASKRLQSYFYDVDPQYATADRAAYASDAGYIGSSLGLLGSYPLSRYVEVFGALRLDSFKGAANDSSPLFETDHGYSAAIGLSWSIWQSKQSAVR